MSEVPLYDRAMSYRESGHSGSEAGSYLRLIDFVYHSTLGEKVHVIPRERRARAPLARVPGQKTPVEG